MTDSPPTSPDASEPDEVLTIQEQIDRLLVQLETAEPGTVDPAALPAGFVSAKQAQTPSKPAAAAEPADAPATVSEAVEAVESAMNEAMQAPAEEHAEVHPATPEADTAPAAQPEDAATTEPAPTATNSAEQDLLASLNTALADLQKGSKPPPAGPTTQPDTAEAPQTTAEPAAQTTEQELQDEIASLLADDEPAAAPQASQAETGQAEAAAADQTHTVEDQIADEIEGLLAQETEAARPEAQAKPTEAEPSIDDLDQMLADEIDQDEELDGDFRSVQEITAGIVTDADGADDQDQHALDAGASASDVAAELDTQPESQAPAPQPAATPAATEPQPRAKQPLDWRGLAARSRHTLLRLCYAINWPARRLMSYEWRETLGYVSLTVAFSALAMWVYIVVF